MSNELSGTVIMDFGNHERILQQLGLKFELMPDMSNDKGFTSYVHIYLPEMDICINYQRKYKAYGPSTDSTYDGNIDEFNAILEDRNTSKYLLEHGYNVIELPANTTIREFNQLLLTIVDNKHTQLYIQPQKGTEPTTYSRYQIDGYFDELVRALNINQCDIDALYELHNRISVLENTNRAYQDMAAILAATHD